MRLVIPCSTGGAGGGITTPRDVVVVTIMMTLTLLTTTTAFTAVSTTTARTGGTIMRNTPVLSFAGSAAPVSTATTHLSMNAGGAGNMWDDFLQGRTQRSQANEAYLQGLAQRVDRINALEPATEDLSDEALTAKTAEFRQRLQAAVKDNKQDDVLNGPLLEEAFAVVREAAWRVLELRHYDVQLLGGLILHDGRLAEMATGEGKTLVSTLPAYLNALTGQTSFVVTVNDYLARRDMEKMGQVHRFLGLTVGLIQAGMTVAERRAAYACDVVYVTNSELGFDYLRDHLALTPEETVLPNAGDGEFAGFCVVDEADSVLIDEARTPLIISKQVPAPANRYAVANQLGQALKKDIHYEVDLKNKNIVLTEQGYRESEKALGVDSLFTIDSADGAAWAPFVANAVKAKELFQKDVEYTITKDGSGKPVGVGIIDAFTGRVLDGRRWSDGLHQSIEAKEGIDVSEQSSVIAKVTYQSLFRQFSRLSGMTGTAMADAQELQETYGLLVTPVPTALPVARRDYPDVAFKTRKAANEALVQEIAGARQAGRPCLVGTTSVAQSEQLVALLEERGIPAELLNASPKNAPRESEIVAQAGRAGVVTVATNMAGRGTDILLGGCPTTMARIQARSTLVRAGVLAVDETEPPQPPSDYFPTPLDDDVSILLKSAASSVKKSLGSEMTAIELDELLTVAFDTTEAEDDPDYIIKLRDAAEAVKALYAETLAEEKENVRKAGGLYVMGTNRHESSRIDQQLRGRAGRQGDPGSSRFFVSFQDDMFVIFGGDSLTKMLQMFRVSEDMPVEAPQIAEALDKVQNAVEEKYREMRKEIFNFDEVLNGQRKAIYSRRRGVLFSDMDKSLETMKEYNAQTVADIVKGQTNDKDEINVPKLMEKMGQFFPTANGVITEADLKGLSQDDATKYLQVVVDEAFSQKANQVNNLGKSCQYISLVTLDNAWSAHLQAMENLKEAVLLRTYQGRDPVSEYRNDAFALFQGLEDTMRFNAVYSLQQSLATTPAPAAAQAA